MQFFSVIFVMALTELMKTVVVSGDALAATEKCERLVKETADSLVQ